MTGDIAVVVLDFGGVLGLPQDPVRARTMASLCGVSMEEFSRLYARDRLELDRGTLSSDSYWGRILRAAGATPTPELVARIEEEDSLAWTRVNPRMLAWSVELRAEGYLTAILSNMPTDKLRYMRESPAFSWMKDFAVTVFSCDYHQVKPEPQIYATCLRLLARQPAECLFLDDSPVNVQAARAMGMEASVFRTTDEAAPEMASSWRLPVKSLRNGSSG